MDGVIIWKNESEIESQRYDMTQFYEGYIDENKYPMPYRHITNWYIVETTKQGEVLHEGKRHIFNDKMKFKSKLNLVLCGQLKPCKEKDSDNQMVHVIVEKLVEASFDRHAIDRGFWVSSKKAYYRLEVPDKKRINYDDGRSQEDIFVRYRALSGALSNIIDMNSNSVGGVSDIIRKYREYEPEDLHRELSLTQEEREFFINNDSAIQVNDPFDLDLFRIESKFLVEQLEEFDKEFPKNCTFYKGLKHLTDEKKKAKLKKESWAMDDSKFNYAESAKLSEMRSSRNAYGGQKMGPEGKWINPFVKLSDIKKVPSVNERVRRDIQLMNEDETADFDMDSSSSEEAIELSSDEESSSTSSDESFQFVSTTKKKPPTKKKKVTKQKKPSSKPKTSKTKIRHSSQLKRKSSNLFNVSKQDSQRTINSINIINTSEQFNKETVDQASHDTLSQDMSDETPSSSSFCSSDYYDGSNYDNCNSAGCFNNEEETDIDFEQFIGDKIQPVDNDILQPIFDNFGDNINTPRKIATKAPESKLNTPPSSPKSLVITPSPLQTPVQPYMPSSPSISPLDECLSFSTSSSDEIENVEQHEIIKKIDAINQQIDALNQQKLKLLRQLQESNNINDNDNDNGDSDGDDKDSPAEENESLPPQDGDYYCSSPAGTQADDEEGSISPWECNKNM